MNFFIEGLQGMGKSTLLQRLSQKYPKYHAYREGDYCPIELAWNSYMTEEEYVAAINRYPSLNEEIENRTVREENKYIVSYTRIITDEPGFHKYMEEFEIYNGRKSLEDFENIILKRYQNLPTENDGNLFECAFLQNIIEELILYKQMSDEQICSFYKRLFSIVPKKDFRLYYLYDENIEDAIMQIRKERSDKEGNQLWYQLMLKYLEESPCGRTHNLQGFEGMIMHFKHRQKLEMQIVKEVLGEYAVVLPAKKYELTFL